MRQARRRWTQDAIVIAVCVVVMMVAGYFVAVAWDDAQRYQYAKMCGATIAPDCKVQELATIIQADPHSDGVSEDTCVTAVRTDSGRVYRANVEDQFSCGYRVDQRVVTERLGSDTQLRQIIVEDRTYHFGHGPDDSLGLLAGFMWIVYMLALIQSGRWLQYRYVYKYQAYWAYFMVRSGMMTLAFFMAVPMALLVDAAVARPWLLLVVAGALAATVGCEYNIRLRRLYRSA